MDEPILIITGPTAVGKTALAEIIANRIDGEIISADSRQIYRYLTIGTAKPIGVWQTISPANKIYTVNNIFYHLVDFLEPTRRFSAGEFASQSRKIITQIQKRKHRPLIVGGTGLYIHSLISGLAPLPSADQNIRKKYHQILETRGRIYLSEKLARIDPVLAAKIGPNPQRLIRALEIFELTGKSPRDFYSRTKPFIHNYYLINLDLPREILASRIEARLKRMLKSGWLEETEKVLKQKYPPDCPGLQSIGYPEIISYLNKKISYTEMTEQIFVSSKQYAKRQQTWARGHNYPTLNIWQMSTQSIVNYILQHSNITVF